MHYLRSIPPYNCSKTILAVIVSGKSCAYFSPKYPVIIPIPFDEMKEKIKQNTRRYAKRQITWFKKNNKIILDRTKNDEELIEIILENI